jgi:hypothetical protein
MEVVVLIIAVTLGQILLYDTTNDSVYTSADCLHLIRSSYGRRQLWCHSEDNDCTTTTSTIINSVVWHPNVPTKTNSGAVTEEKDPASKKDDDEDQTDDKGVSDPTVVYDPVSSLSSSSSTRAVQKPRWVDTSREVQHGTSTPNRNLPPPFLVEP